MDRRPPLSPRHEGRSPALLQLADPWRLAGVDRDVLRLPSLAVLGLLRGCPVHHGAVHRLSVVSVGPARPEFGPGTVDRDLHVRVQHPR